MNKKITWGLLGLLALGGGGWLALPYILPPQITPVSLTTGTAIEAVYATGTIEPTIMVPLAPRTTSRLTALNADEGQDVLKGAVLAQMEDTDLLASIAEFTAKLNFAENDLHRKSTLFAAKSISGDVYDTAKATRDSIAAQLDAAKAKASYFQMLAPADGKIVKRDGEIGQVINAGTPVFYFTCCAPLRITAEVDEESIAEVKIGMPVLIQSDNFKDKIYHGSVNAVTPMGDSVSRSYRVRIAINESDNPFMIGMTTETNIILRQNDKANLLPSAAIGPQDKVQKINGDRVTILSPKIGSKGTNGSDKTEIISGIEPTDRIVSPYNLGLKEGDKIRLRKE